MLVTSTGWIWKARSPCALVFIAQHPNDLLFWGLFVRCSVCSHTIQCRSDAVGISWLPFTVIGCAYTLPFLCKSLFVCAHCLFIANLCVYTLPFQCKSLSVCAHCLSMQVSLYVCVCTLPFQCKSLWPGGPGTCSLSPGDPSALR